MSDSAESLRRKIDSAGDLQSVVRTMKALAASSIGQYERSVLALGDYHRTVELGLSLCLRSGASAGPLPENHEHSEAHSLGAIVFGSDLGLVGQFNDVIVDFAAATLAKMPGKPQVWAVGERVYARLAEAGLAVVGLHGVPDTVAGIAPLVGRILLDSDALQPKAKNAELLIFHNRPVAGAVYEPLVQRLLPLDQAWRNNLATIPWPTKNLPEVMGNDVATLRALIREYLFVSLFRACAESLASENASRLAAMQRADKNIDELLEELNRNFHRIRQDGIDEELFDVVSGFEALLEERPERRNPCRQAPVPMSSAALRPDN